MGIKGVRTAQWQAAHQGIIAQAQAAYTQLHGNLVGFVASGYILGYDEFLER